MKLRPLNPLQENYLQRQIDVHQVHQDVTLHLDPQQEEGNLESRASHQVSPRTYEESAPRTRSADMVVSKTGVSELCQFLEDYVVELVDPFDVMMMR